MKNISTHSFQIQIPKQKTDPSAPSLPNLSSLMDEEQEIGILHTHLFIHLNITTIHPNITTYICVYMCIN